jgi:hypothetical protein
MKASQEKILYEELAQTLVTPERFSPEEAFVNHLGEVAVESPDLPETSRVYDQIPMFRLPMSGSGM